MPSDVSPAYNRSFEELLEDLDLQPGRGLTGQQIRQRRERYGRNRLREAKRRSFWLILLDQLKSVVILLLVVAAVLAFSFAQWAEGVAIVAVVLVNALIGLVSEWRAVRSMEALRQMGKLRVRVRRDGQQRQIPVDALVPGDMVLFESGDVAPADIRLIEANNVRVDESPLTGESVAVNKSTDPVESDCPLAERTSMLFKGTTVVEGSGEGVVVATGMQTELGHIAELAESAEKEATPLERRLNRLGARLAWITIAIAALVAVAGLAAGRPTLLMVETAIALGVAAIPEGLPIVATIALARGMWLMARRNALINRLAAVETLGATRVIFSDKTGTLTENKMTLRHIVTSAGRATLDSGDGREVPGRAGSESQPESPGKDHDAPARLLNRILQIGALCNNASLTDTVGDGVPDQSHGDPTEAALLLAAAQAGIDHDTLLKQKPEVREVAFDPDVMMMATYHRNNGDLEVAVKGAPGAVLQACNRVAVLGAEDSTIEDRPVTDEDRDQWRDWEEQLAAEGLRLLAVADKRVDDESDEPYQDLRLLGLVGLLDPPRQNVTDAIAACQSAGIRLIMVTGDQPATARAIARQVGLTGSDGGESAVHGSELGAPEDLSDEDRRHVLAADVFARVSPEQKLRLVEIFQDEGEIVAMTGDGVNDAPALKKADIGIAMGRRGTDAAREAADMVLKDDALSSVVAAIREGRIIFGNIRKSVMFMLCTNVAEIVAVAIAAALNAPLPLRPLQILYLNVITDVLPALALGVGKGTDRVMDQPPRPKTEPVLARSHWLAIGGWSVLIAACVLTGLAAGMLWLQVDRLTAITMSFLTLAFAKLWFVLNLRDRGSTVFRNDVIRNPWMWGAIGVCIALLLAAVYLPGLSNVLQTRPLDATAWLIVLLLSALPLLAGQMIHMFPMSSDSSSA